LNNQLSALATLQVTPITGDAISRRHSLLVGGPPRGITLSRQNSISSQTPSDKSTQRGAVTRRPSSCLSPAGQSVNDARMSGDKTTTPTTTIGADQSDLAAETASKNLEASSGQAHRGRSVDNYQQFRRLLKTHLLNLAFN